MFKDKKFTAAFIFLSILIVFLSAVLIYLVVSDGKSIKPIVDPTPPASSSEAQSSKEEDEPSSSEEAPTEDAKKDGIRALTVDDAHSCPVINEPIPTAGVLTVLKPGANGDGLVFHRKPLFDAATAEGNKKVFSGDFRITAKIYIEDNGIAYLMYQTEDGYFVTSSSEYVRFTADNGTESDSRALGEYFANSSAPANVSYHVTVYREDGENLVFSLYETDDAGTYAVLSNVIAKYDGYGNASFEYQDASNEISDGLIRVEENPAAGSGKMKITVVFYSPLELPNGSVSQLVLEQK